MAKKKLSPAAQKGAKSRKAKAARASRASGGNSALDRANAIAKKGPKSAGKHGSKGKVAAKAKAPKKVKATAAKRGSGKFASAYADRKSQPWYKEYRLLYDRGYYMVRDSKTAAEKKRGEQMMADAKALRAKYREPNKPAAKDGMPKKRAAAKVKKSASGKAKPAAAKKPRARKPKPAAEPVVAAPEHPAQVETQPDDAAPAFETFVIAEVDPTLL